ncbi:MAG: response regulator transcription factor [Nitrococcus sp.]|nr:response regulator transcription factor [Nitrococcus sp.]
MTIRVLLVDDHTVMREGLHALLEKRPDIEVIGEAGNGLDALKMVAERAPDVVVMDIAMRELNGIEATRRIRARHPHVRVIGLSTHADKRYVLEMLEAGALGYLLKESAAEELYRAIRAVARNHRYLSKHLAEAVAHHRPGQRGAAMACQLTPREREVLQLLAEGRSSPYIGQRLNISARTADAHRRHIMEKLNLHSVADLTRYAIREGIAP